MGDFYTYKDSDGQASRYTNSETVSGYALGAVKPSKSMPPEQNEAVRRFTRAWIEKNHTSALAAAKALGVAQGHLSEFLAGKRGAGMKLITALQSKTDASIEEILGLRSPSPRPTGTVTAEPLDRYPERALALDFLRGEADERALELVRGSNYLGAERRNRHWWVAKVREAEEDLKAHDADPTLAERERAHNAALSAPVLAKEAAMRENFAGLAEESARVKREQIEKDRQAREGKRKR